MNSFRLVLGLALVFGSAGGTLASDAAEEAVTIGDLAVRLADMVTGKPYDAEGAIAILDQIGVALPHDPGRSVRHQDLIDAADQLGIRLTTTDPARPVTSGDLRLLGHLFDLERSTAQDPCPPGFDGQSCNAVKCRGGENQGSRCDNDSQCPGGFCRIPPGLGKKVVSVSG